MTHIRIKDNLPQENKDDSNYKKKPQKPKSDYNVHKEVKKVKSQIREMDERTHFILSKLDELFNEESRRPRAAVQRLLNNPSKYVRRMTHADYESFEPYTSTFYSALETNAYECPAMARFQWFHIGRISNLTSLEVRKLEKQQFTVQEHRELIHDVETPHYIFWRTKHSFNLWLSLMLSDQEGPTWHFSTAPTIKAVRTLDHARWKPLTPLNHTHLIAWGEDESGKVPELDQTRIIVRESLAAVINDPIFRKTVPLELRRRRDFQISLMKLGMDAVRNLRTQPELENAILANARRVDPQEL